MESLPVTKCTREKPWNLEAHSSGIVAHVDAVLLFSDYHGGYFECPNCGIRYELVKDEEPFQASRNGRV